MSEKEVDVVESLEPKAQVYRVVLAEGTENEIVLTQKPLSFFGKIELFSVLGNAVEKALTSGTTISDLLETPEGSVDSFKEADAFVGAIASVAKVAPELISDIFCIALGVKRGEREYIKELLENENDEKMLEVERHFIEQNTEAVLDFFAQQMKLVQETSQKMQSKSTSSKPSKATRQRTTKA